MISVTGICTEEDINTIHQLALFYSKDISFLWNFCCSFNRMEDKRSRSVHSPSVLELGELMKRAREILPVNHKIGLHYKPKSIDSFAIEIRQLLEMNYVYANLDFIQITGLWADRKELNIIKQLYPHLMITLQVPTYKMGYVSVKSIIEQLACYMEIIDGITIDNSGGKGVEHNIDLSSAIIREAIAQNVKKDFIIAGGIAGDNVQSIMNNIFNRTEIICSVDSQSKMHMGNTLLKDRLDDYIEGVLLFYQALKEKTSEHG